MDRSEVTNLIEFLKIWFNQFSTDSVAVIGISGGKDSTVAAKLLVDALGKDRVFGVMMPNGIQSDIDDSIRVCRLLGINNTTINIEEPYNAFLKALSNIPQTEQQRINLAPRIRMTTLYAVAQSFSVPAFVVNTCNKSEDYVGYSTKYGDAAGDIAVLQDYLVSEIREIGDILELPRDLVHKTPSDGLCGKTDEDNLGFTYDELDRYIKWNEKVFLRGKCPISKELVQLIEAKHNANLHKLKPIPSKKSIEDGEKENDSLTTLTEGFLLGSLTGL